MYVFLMLYSAHLQVAYSDFVAAGSLAAAREKGLVIEGHEKCSFLLVFCI